MTHKKRWAVFSRGKISRHLTIWFDHGSEGCDAMIKWLSMHLFLLTVTTWYFRGKVFIKNFYIYINELVYWLWMSDLCIFIVTHFKLWFYLVKLVKPVIGLVFRFNHETLCKFIYLFNIVCLCDKAKTTVSSAHKCHHMYEEKKLSLESILKISKIPNPWRENCDALQNGLFSSHLFYLPHIQ